MILPKKRDPRFITVQRGGALQDVDYHLLAIWAADESQCDEAGRLECQWQRAQLPSEIRDPVLDDQKLHDPHLQGAEHAAFVDDKIR